MQKFTKAFNWALSSPYPSDDRDSLNRFASSIGTICFSVLILIASTSKSRGQDTVWLNWISFCSSNESAIATENNLGRQSVQNIKGLEISDKSLDSCATWGRSFSNVVELRITSEMIDPLSKLILAATNFPNLKYLHLEMREACQVSRAINLLTNMTNLGYLGLDAPKATNVDVSIYELSQLKELSVRIWGVSLPQGISRLGKLQRMEIFGNRRTTSPALPRDFADSPMRYLEVMNVSGADEWLPNLPKDLVELHLPSSRLKVIPRTWITHNKLEILDLNNVRLGRFPSEALEIPSLKVLDLSLNNITTVPPIKLQSAKTLKINLWGNEIQHMAPENKDLISKGQIEQ